MESVSLSKQFYSFLWAYILVALSTCLGVIVDGIIVGNLISEDAVSAINLTRPAVQFVGTLHMLVNGGAGMLVGYALGHQNLTEAHRYFTRTLSFAIVFGVITAIFGGVLYPDAATRLLCNHEHLFPLTRDYLKVMLLGMPAFMMMWMFSTMVGVDGSPKLVSAAVIIDNVVNLLLDIVFIKFLGWGIAGSSAATVVGHLVGIAIVLIFWLRSEKRQLKPMFTLKRIAPDWWRILTQGAPFAVSSFCLTLLFLISNAIVLSTMGRVGIFAYAVCMNALMIYNLYLSGACQTMMSLGSIQVGKGDKDGLALVLRKSFSFVTISIIITCLVIWVFPEQISKLFGADETSMLAESNHALRIFAVSFIFFCYIYLFMMVYKLYGHHRMALFISFALSATVIPVFWVVAHTAPGYLWYSYLIAYAIEIIAIYMIHKIGRMQFVLSNSNDEQKN